VVVPEQERTEVKLRSAISHKKFCFARERTTDSVGDEAWSAAISIGVTRGAAGGAGTPRGIGVARISAAGVGALYLFLVVIVLTTQNKP